MTKRNYTELPKLVDEYGARGLKVLAFPCNQFGAQEPGSHEEIIEFVKQFDADMPEKLTFFEKSDVNGANAREPFSFLKNACPNDDGTLDIRWNFGKFLACVVLLPRMRHVYDAHRVGLHYNPVKFLVDHEGNAFKRYTGTAPNDMIDDIEALLKKKEESS